LKKSNSPAPFLNELFQMNRRAKELGDLARLETLATVQDKQGREFPIQKITFGNPDPKAPVLGIVGGVHGLERIGAQVSVAFLNMLSNLVLWDSNTAHALGKIRVFFIPVINPTGIYNRTRANAKGVDLMRNAPVQADNPPFLVGGHYYSPKLPWYRGPEGGPMEVESQVLVDSITKEIEHSSLALTLDIHSGFGTQDQIWFPYAKTQTPFPHLPHLHSLIELFDKTFPHHFYRIEPQAENYTTHGDLWDYIYDEQRRKNPQATYLPICLEMGSWMWLKKNPLQIFLAEGPFNPIKKHREKRILRRHYTFFDFLIKALSSEAAWSVLNEEQAHKHLLRAKDRWYGKKR
jgi:hypothetical protein